MTIEDLIGELMDARAQTNPTMETQARVEGTSLGLEVSDVVIRDDCVELVIGS